uniref:MAM domain-containing protein n=1 Tax=Callorhinchus milii TaxID=7868 RepID=A0A4W3GCP7_CALMI
LDTCPFSLSLFLSLSLSLSLWLSLPPHPLPPPVSPPRSYMLVNSSKHSAGQRAHFILPSLSENDTHCIQFSFFLSSREGRAPGSLAVYVRVNGGPVGSPVWNMSRSFGKQWLQAELAVSTFWPNEYQADTQLSPGQAQTASLAC